MAEPVVRRLSAPLRSVRARAAIGAVLVVGAALGVGAAGLLAVMRQALFDELTAATRLRAVEIAAALETGEMPSLAVDEADEQLIQVVGTGGEVLASSANVAGLPPLARLQDGAVSRITPPIGDEPFVAVAVAADTGAGVRRVVVARSTDDVGESTGLARGLLVLGSPLLLLVVGATTWWLVGRALAPVEAIRSEVEAISARELGRRVPEPTTGDEIGRLAHTMNAMLERLDAAQQRQRRFVADASHELRSPLASIRQHAEVAGMHPGRFSADELAAAVGEDAARMQRLVDDLLLLARTDEGTLLRRTHEIDLDDLVLAEARRLRTDGVAVDTTGVTAARLEGDEAGMARVVRNLAENAARHARSRLAFSTESGENGIHLIVDDDGPGIPAEQRNHVFERFVRLDEARARETGGTGLGLAIVAEVVAAHGGTVIVEDAPLGGARFHVRLPAARRA